MKRPKNIIASLLGSILLSGFALTFNACTSQSPLGLANSSEEELVEEPTVLYKSEGQDEEE